MQFQLSTCNETLKVDNNVWDADLFLQIRKQFNIKSSKDTTILKSADKWNLVLFIYGHSL